MSHGFVRTLSTGDSGFSGFSGASGWSGISGFSGTSGISGFSGPSKNRYFLRYTASNSVPGGGTLYLSAGGVTTSSAGELLTTASTLIGIAVSVGTAATKDYDVEIVSDPAGSPSVLGTLALTSGNTTNSRRDLSASIGSSTLVGARMVRTSGGGASVFSNIIVEVEVSIP